jgi:hypothetical protein
MLTVAPAPGNLSDLGWVAAKAREMLGGLVVSRLSASGGDIPEAAQVRTGLLGADYEVAEGRYRFSHVFNGGNWNPQLRAPLTQPGAYQNSYGPIDFYGVNTARINLGDLFGYPRLQRRVVLSTSDGKYVTPSSLSIWNPVHQFFENHLTAVVRPVRTVYKNTATGGNAEFGVEMLYHDGETQVVPIYSSDTIKSRNLRGSN